MTKQDAIEALNLALLQRASQGREQPDGSLDPQTQRDLEDIGRFAAQGGLARFVDEDDATPPAAAPA